ncbi:hypothetical protein ACFX2H_029823 [Malus domestica]
MPVLGSSFVPAVHYTSTTHGDTYYPDCSNLNGKPYLPQQVANLTNALTQQTTLVNQFLKHIEMQRVPDEVSQSKTRAEERDPFQGLPGKKLFNPSRTVRLGNVHYHFGPRGYIFSRLDS